ncbi:MAG: hypothetical protein EA401_03250 [Planctomycetota bacterium]|nr:MAG: hypothetical protein EA401_03250 [Planctomycetota bacterium]
MAWIAPLQYARPTVALLLMAAICLPGMAAEPEGTKPEVITPDAAEGNDLDDEKGSTLDLTQAGMIHIPAGTLSLSDAVTLLRDGGQQRVLLGLGVRGEQSMRVHAAEDLPWWQALDRIASAFDLIIHSTSRDSDDAHSHSGGAWQMVHHRHRTVRRNDEPIESTLRTLPQAIALSHNHTQHAKDSGSATFGPWRIIASELVQHQAGMLSGTQRWVEIPYRILGEPRFAEYHDVHATITWETASNAAGSKRFLGEPSIATMRSGGQHQMVRARSSRHSNQPNVDSSASLVVSGLRSGDRSLILEGTVTLEAFQAWQHTATIPAQEWQDMETPAGPLRVLLHQERDLDQDLLEGLHLSTNHMTGPVLIWVLEGSERSIPNFTLHDANGREVRNDGSRSSTQRGNSLQTLMSVRMAGEMQGPFTLSMSGMSASDEATLPLRLEVMLP